MIDVQRYLQQGYSMDEINEAMAELDQEQNQLNYSYNNAMAMNQNQPRVSNTLVAGQQNQDNLIKWQLELDSILERIEHILRGDKPTTVNGNLIFVPTKNETDKVLNEYGVAEIMRILSMYLNRNTILSNYDEPTILLKVYDFGMEVSDLLFVKSDEMGLNSLDKRKRYSMIVRELVDSVHSAYLRALNGGERDSLRQARNITQSENIGQGGQMMPGGMQMMRERSVLNPMRWLRGKYG
jgi:hypothetical protein